MRPVANVMTHGLLGEQKLTGHEIRVYLRCVDRSMRFSWIRAPWYPGMSPKDSQIILVCPWCNQQLRIPGYSKTLKHEMLPDRIPITLPPVDEGGDTTVYQTYNVTIEEKCGCPRCGKFFRLEDNTLSGVAR